MISFFRPKISLGLDVGSACIKAAVIDHSRRDPELVRGVVTPMRSTAHGDISSAELISKAIKATLDAADVSSRHVITAVGGRDVMVKKIQIERMRSRQVREVIEWEAAQHLPFDMQSMAFDYQILDSNADTAEMNILLVAAKRERVEDTRRVLGASGVIPSVVVADAVALHNVLALSCPDAMKSVVGLLNIGHSVTNLSIHQQGVPVLSRDLSVGTRQIHDDLRRGGEDIVAGVERGAALLSSANEAFTLRTVYLCGGGARIPGLSDLIAVRLRVRVEQVNPVANLCVRDGAFDPLRVEDVAPVLTLATGLALYRPS